MGVIEYCASPVVECMVAFIVVVLEYLLIPAIPLDLPGIASGAVYTIGSSNNSKKHCTCLLI